MAQHVAAGKNFVDLGATGAGKRGFGLFERGEKLIDRGRFDLAQPREGVGDGLTGAIQKPPATIGETVQAERQFHHRTQRLRGDAFFLGKNFPVQAGRGRAGERENFFGEQQHVAAGNRRAEKKPKMNAFVAGIFRISFEPAILQRLQKAQRVGPQQIFPFGKFVGRFGDLGAHFTGEIDVDDHLADGIIGTHQIIAERLLAGEVLLHFFNGQRFVNGVVAHATFAGRPLAREHAFATGEEAEDRRQRQWQRQSGVKGEAFRRERAC